MKKIFILMIFTLILSCQKQQENFSKAMIEKLDVIDNGLPSYYGFLNLYISTKNNEFIETNCDYLFLFYKLYYKKEFENFKDFLNGVLNNDYRIDKNLFIKLMYIKSFKLNQEIEKQYSELGFDKFLLKYSEKTSGNRHKLKLKKSIINDGEYQSIVYFLYKNRYDISKDCYIGNDYIVKREDYFNPSK